MVFELSGVRFGWSRVVIFSNAVFDYSFAKYDYGDDVMVIKFDHHYTNFAPWWRKHKFQVTGSKIGKLFRQFLKEDKES